jgi:hypothetical protein
VRFLKFYTNILAVHMNKAYGDDISALNNALELSDAAT